MFYNAFMKSMAGVGGQSQLARIKHLDLANLPFGPTAYCAVPRQLANLNLAEMS